MKVLRQIVLLVIGTCPSSFADDAACLDALREITIPAVSFYNQSFAAVIPALERLIKVNASSNIAPTIVLNTNPSAVRIALTRNEYSNLVSAAEATMTKRFKIECQQAGNRSVTVELRRIDAYSLLRYVSSIALTDFEIKDCKVIFNPAFAPECRIYELPTALADSITTNDLEMFAPTGSWHTCAVIQSNKLVLINTPQRLQQFENIYGQIGTE